MLMEVIDKHNKSKEKYIGSQNKLRLIYSVVRYATNTFVSPKKFTRQK